MHSSPSRVQRQSWTLLNNQNECSYIWFLGVTGWNLPYRCFKQQQKQACVLKPHTTHTQTNINEEGFSLWFPKGSCALNITYSASLGNHVYWPIHAKQIFHGNKTLNTISATYNPTMSTRLTFSNVYVALPWLFCIPKGTCSCQGLF